MKFKEIWPLDLINLLLNGGGFRPNSHSRWNHPKTLKNDLKETEKKNILYIQKRFQTSLGGIATESEVLNKPSAKQILMNNDGAAVLPASQTANDLIQSETKSEEPSKSSKNRVKIGWN